MKKTLFFVTLIVGVLMLSCKKEESTGNESTDNGGGGTTESVVRVKDIKVDLGNGTQMYESWVWDGNKVNKVMHYYGNQVDWTEDYTYENGKIVRVDDYINSEYTLYGYEGGKLSVASYYSEGILEEEYMFEYNGSKISKIQILLYGDKFEGRLLKNGHNPLTALLPSNLFEKMTTDVNSRGIAEMYLSWSGNNVSQVIYDGGTFRHIYDFSYDNKLNPFFNILTLYADEYFYSTDMPASKNNVERVMHKYEYGGEIVQTDVMKYSYEYENNLPLSRVLEATEDTEILYYSYN